MPQDTPSPKEFSDPLIPSSNEQKRLAMLVKVPRARPEETPKEFSLRALKAMAKSVIVAMENGELQAKPRTESGQRKHEQRD